MIYADYNSTSPVLPSVIEAMQPYLAREFGNPSAVYQELGRRARAAVEEARESVASLINCRTEEVVFLSGGTESCFQALVGAALGAGHTKGMATCSAVEHPAVLEALEFLVSLGFSTRRIPVDRSGELDREAWDRIADDAALLSVMLGNNETGVRFPVQDLFASLDRDRTVTHTDATQAVGRLAVDFNALGCDLLSFSGHKLGAPKGIGVLVVRDGARWLPPMKGGGQERGRRGGTEAVSQIVGLGQAARDAASALQQCDQSRIERLRDAFEQEISERIGGVRINGQTTARLPNTSSVTISGVNGLELVKRLAENDIVISTGSACKTSTFEPSYVLSAIGLSAAECLSTVRVSFGSSNGIEDVGRLADAFERLVKDLRTIARAELKVLLGK